MSAQCWECRKAAAAHGKLCLDCHSVIDARGWDGRAWPSSATPVEAYKFPFHLIGDAVVAYPIVVTGVKLYRADATRPLLHVANFSKREIPWTNASNRVRYTWADADAQGTGRTVGLDDERGSTFRLIEEIFNYGMTWKRLLKGAPLAMTNLGWALDLETDSPLFVLAPVPTDGEGQ